MIKFKIPVFIVLSLVHFKLVAQENVALVNSLNEVIRPIATLDAAAPFTDLAFLRPIIQEKNIVALGEATHGTHEFFVYKDRLIRYMVTTLGYKSIAFESDFSATQQLDDFINKKTDQLKFDGGGFPLILETKIMLNWLRQYNDDKPPGERVHIYGLEARGFSNIIKQVLAALPVLPRDVALRLHDIEIADYRNLKKEDINQLVKIMPVIYQTARSAPDSSVTLHYVDLLKQTAANFLHYKFGDRDGYLFENANWVINQSGNSKLIIWAHNGHVAKSSLFKQPSLGNLLSKRYGSKYLSVATDFNTGNVNLFVNRKLQKVNYPDVMSIKAYEFYFKQCRYKNFIIDIATAQSNLVLKQFFNKKLDMRMIGGTDDVTNWKLAIAENFDLLIYFNSTTASD
ncbi:erythromycin esterase family protein [Mucilaginibacter glaciei]|uniref:Erythromycin esterase family protein n=1 Tax=Mucilaginibacter glaciei TaxID=2772109 RepID=A0A926S869_9SPHI|nr:erythromycin esterase family protein [Mucilaginibacter glaciei]MBD1395471.1 erythromycin esterase family protein [Mucilaginibacter glaciei]